MGKLKFQIYRTSGTKSQRRYVAYVDFWTGILLAYLLIQFHLW